MLVGGVARADERPIGDAIALGPSRCLDVASLAQHVGMWLKKRTVDSRLSIEVADAAGGVSFVVRREGSVIGKRTLHVEKVACQEIHAAVGLGVASAIDAAILDDLGIAGPSVPTAAPVPIAPPAPAPHPPPVVPGAAVWPQPAPFVPALPQPARPAEPDRSKEREQKGPVLTATLHGMVLVGVLPEVTLALAPCAELSVIRGFDLRAAALITDTVTLDVGTGTADASLIAGRLDACATRIVLDDVARLRGCVGLLVGAVAAQGSGFPDARSATSAWIAPSLRTDARWSLSRAFGLVVGLDGFFPGLKPELQVVSPSGRVIAAETFPLAGVGVSMGPSLTF